MTSLVRRLGAYLVNPMTFPRRGLKLGPLLNPLCLRTRLTMQWVSGMSLARFGDLTFMRPMVPGVMLLWTLIP